MEKSSIYAEKNAGNKISKPFLPEELYITETKNIKYATNKKYMLNKEAEKIKIKKINEDKDSSLVQQIKKEKLQKELFYKKINSKTLSISKFELKSKKMNAQLTFRPKISKYIFIYILLCLFCNVYSQINLRKNKINIIMILYSYEVTLKVKDTGIKNILGSSSSHIYPCPSKMYLNNELITNISNCHYIDIIELDSEIKMEWNNIIINSMKGMFYNCTEIMNIDMTKFDTSLVTDMSYMFSFCSSLTSLNISNLDTINVQTMENMFYNCTNLISINLESFTIPFNTSLYNMFYGCENLEHVEYINIKNLEEKENINIDEMFSNIAPNAVICLSSCPSPVNFTIDSIKVKTSQITVKWEGNEWNKYIISYGTQNFKNPESGTKINIVYSSNYTFTNISEIKYDIYLQTDCGGKTSDWIGPLTIPFESYNMKYKDSNSINTTSMVIYDSGGPNGNNLDNDDSILTVYPETSEHLIYIKGSVNLEPNYDYLYIYDGKGISGKQLGKYGSSSIIPLLVFTPGRPMTIRFKTDHSVQTSGFQLIVGYMINTQIKNNLIKSNNCQIISCDNDWKIIQNKMILNTDECVEDCELTDTKYQYRGKCYSTCPNNTGNINYTCYSNSVLEKCETYSIYSDYENLCITCKNNYYPMLNDKRNKNNFINCYKNNSLEKYYLDNNDLYFKPCYKTCKKCNKKGTVENHNCLTCDINYELNLTVGEYYNCYKKCDYYYYKNNQIYCEMRCPKNLPYEIIETQTCVDYCTINEMEINNKLCRINFKSNIKNETDEVFAKMINTIRNELQNELDTSSIDSGEDIIIQEQDVTIIITKSSNQKNNNNLNNSITNIDFSKCEEKLKEAYNIPGNDSIYIFQLEILQEGYTTPIIQYEFYYPLYEDTKLYLLNLSVCNDVKLDIYVALNLTVSVDQIDPKSDFYNDICNTYTSENGTDVTLSERKNNYINNNLSVCELNCEFEGYNETTGKAKCSCPMKTDFITQLSETLFNTDKLYESFTDFSNIFNLKVLKCTKLIFTVKAFMENYANIILIIIILMNLVCLIYFVFKDYKDTIKYNKNIIIYFTLYQTKVFYIIQKKKKEEKRKMFNNYKPSNNLNNNTNNLSYNIYNTLNLNQNQLPKRKKKLKKLKKKREEIFTEEELPTCLRKSSKKNLRNIKDNISNPTKKKSRIKRKKIELEMTDEEFIKKIKLEEITIANSKKFKKYEKIFNKFKGLTEDKIYELYKKIYTKTDNELNDLPYKSALKYDKRKFFIYYLSLIKTKHILFFSFLPKFDFNSKMIKIYLFFFNFATFFFINALFFTDNTMGKINQNGGSFDFIYNLPQIIYSNIISSFINEIINLFALVEDAFIEYRNIAKRENVFRLSKQLIKTIIIKIVIFCILDLILLIFYWIYLSCFSAVYKNTQKHLLKDTLISFGTSFIYPFFFYLLPGLFRMLSLKSENRKILYGLTKILQFF